MKPEELDDAHRFMDGISVYIQPLLNKSRQQRPQVIGTALLVEDNGAYYIVSAAHVLKNINSIFFYPGGDQPRKITGALELTHPFGEMGSSDRLDLGVARLLGGPMPPYEDWRALPIAVLRRQTLPRPTEQYCFAGFPSSRGKANPLTKIIKISPTGLMRMPTAFSKAEQLGLSEASHLIFDVDRKAVTRGGSAWELPVLNGISGSPIWCADEKGAHIVGIAIEYHREKKLLVATDIGVVLDLIEAVRKETDEILTENPDAFD